MGGAVSSAQAHSFEGISRKRLEWHRRLMLMRYSNATKKHKLLSETFKALCTRQSNPLCEGYLTVRQFVAVFQTLGYSISPKHVENILKALKCPTQTHPEITNGRRVSDLYCYKEFAEFLKPSSNVCVHQAGLSLSVPNPQDNNAVNGMYTMHIMLEFKITTSYNYFRIPSSR